MTAATRYIRPGRATALFNGVIAGLTRAGVSVWGSRVLAVRGRTSGEMRTTPVNLLTVDGERYLVAPRGVTQWVRNIRVAGEAELRVGRRVEPVRVGRAGRRREARPPARVPEAVEVRGGRVLRRRRRLGLRRDPAPDRPRLPGLPGARAVVVDRCRRRLPVSVGTGPPDQRPSDRPDTAHYVRSVQRAKSAIKALISAGRSCWVQWPQPGSSSAARRSGTRLPQGRDHGVELQARDHQVALARRVGRGHR